MVNSGTWPGNSARVQTDEDVAGEEAVPGGLGNHPDWEAVVWVGASAGILNEHISSLEIRGHQVVEPIKFFGGKFFIDLAPPDSDRDLPGNKR